MPCRRPDWGYASEAEMQENEIKKKIQNPWDMVKYILKRRGAKTVRDALCGKPERSFFVEYW